MGAAHEDQAPPPAWLEALTDRHNAWWLEPLVRWIDRTWFPDPGARLIDLGCGDLQLAELLPGAERIDGVDPSPRARAAARRRLERLGRPWTVVSTVDELPDRGYQGVVASSVLQYFADEDEVVAVLRRALELLAPDHRGIIATDVVTTPRRSRAEALDAWRVARRSVGTARAPIVLGTGAVRYPHDLLALDPPAVERIAATLGLEAVPLANLTPFSTRSTWWLAPPAVDGHPQAGAGRP